MKLTKRWIALVLCLLMVVSVLPMGIFAEETATSDSTDSTEGAQTAIKLHEKLSFDDLKAEDELTASYFNDHYKNVTWRTMAGYEASKLKAIADPENSQNIVLAPSGSNTYASLIVDDVNDAITNGTVDISMRLYLLSHTGTQAKIAMIRVIDGNGKQLNPFVINTANKGTVTDEGTVFGTLTIAGSSATGGTDSSATLYANRWHEVRMRYTAATGQTALYLDGELALSVTLSAVTKVDYLILNRSFSESYITNYIDDVSICSVEESAETVGINAFNDLNSVPYTPTAEGATSGAMSGDLPQLAGFTTNDSSYSSKACTVVEENGDRYISLPVGDKALSWKYKDAENLLYKGKFEFSMDFQFLEGVTASCGLFSLMEQDPNVGAANTNTEMRVLHSVKNAVYFGPGANHYLFTMETGTWYNISVAVEPVGQTYDIYLNGVLTAYTEWRDAETYVLHIYRDGAWTEKVNPTWADSGKRFPYGYYDTETYGIYGINLFHYGTGGYSFDDLCIRSLSDEWNFERTTNSSTLYDVDFDSFFAGDPCLGCFEASSPAGLPAVQAIGAVSYLADGSKAFVPKGERSLLRLSLGDESYHYLESGTLWVEGNLSLALGGTASDIFTFAALERHTNSGRTKSVASLVTVDGTGAVYLLGQKTGKKLTANQSTLLKVGINSLTKQVELYMEGGAEPVATATLANSSYSSGVNTVRSERIFFAEDTTPLMLTLFEADSMALTVTDFRVYNADFATASVLGVQKSATGNRIRILAGVSNLDYSKVGFSFELLGDDGRTWELKEVAKTDKVYSSIRAEGEDVIATDLGCRYIVAAVITDIPAELDEILCVRPFTVQDSIYNYGESVMYSVRSSDGGLSIEATDITAREGTTLVSGNSFEDMPESCSQYSVLSATNNDAQTVYDTLIAANKYHKWGGQLNDGVAKVGGDSTDAHTGEKALHIYNLKARADINNANVLTFGGRVKLGHLLPDQLTDYIGKTIRISGYVKMDDFKKVTSSTSVNEETNEEVKTYSTVDHTGTVKFGFGIMTDKTYTMYTNTYTATAGEWMYVEYEFDVTSKLLSNSDFAFADGTFGKHYPARVCLTFGEVGGFASQVWLDDIKVECKDSFGVTLPSIFADGMVLQRNKTVPIWGWAGNPGDKIRATVGSASAEATVNNSGELWLELPAMSASSSETLTITNLSRENASVTFKNVGIGDVWYCSGQSNMELKVASVHNADEIVALANHYDVRSFKMTSKATYTLAKDVTNGRWAQVTSSNVKSMSAIAYMTAYQLQAAQGVPVAIIESYNGGSSAQAWLDYDAVFAADRADIYNNEDWIPKKADGSVLLNSYGCEGRTMWGDYNFYWQIGTQNEGNLLAEGSQGSTGNRFAPTGFYNGTQGPLAGYALAGVMWYQGESRPNSFKSEQYNYVLHDLIEQWRRDFRDEDLPVVLFQLAPYSIDEFKLVRQVQLDTAKRMDHVYAITSAYEGYVSSAPSGGVCLDLDRSMSNGWGNAIHPGTKKPLADRAAYTILANEYGMYDTYAEYLNPEYQTLTVSGNVATLTFSNAVGLKVRDGDEALTGFRVYAADGTELSVVSAVIDGTSVVITTAEGTSPAKIYYAYENAAERREVSYPSLVEKDGFDPQYITVLSGNLENGKGQPAIPFMASLSDVSLYEASAADGKLYVEIRELGHLCSSYKLEISVNGNVTEHVASFVTAGNYVIDSISVSAGDAVVVTLKTADGATVLAETTVDVK